MHPFRPEIVIPETAAAVQQSSSAASTRASQQPAARARDEPTHHARSVERAARSSAPAHGLVAEPGGDARERQLHHHNTNVVGVLYCEVW